MNFSTRVAEGGGRRKLTILCAVWCVSGIGLYQAVHRVPQTPSYHVFPDGSIRFFSESANYQNLRLLQPVDKIDGHGIWQM